MSDDLSSFKICRRFREIVGAVTAAPLRPNGYAGLLYPHSPGTDAESGSRPRQNLESSYASIALAFTEVSGCISRSCVR